MKFGFGLITCQRYPGDRRTDTDLYRQALELVDSAEALGFDSAWVSEHHFWDDAYMPSLLPVCAAAGARTSSIVVGTAVLLTPFYDPLRLAEDAATVDLISGGRFILGLGQGWMPHEFDAFHVQPRGRHRRFVDTIEVLRQAWSDGLVTGHGEISYPGVFVTPKPSRPAGPPIWIGADREPAIRRSGRIANGFMSSSALDPKSWEQQVRWVADEAEQAGRDPNEIVLSLAQPAFAWRGADAWNRVRDYVYYVDWKYEEMLASRDRSQPMVWPPPLTTQRADEMRRRSLIGQPEEIVEQLLAFQAVTPGELHYIARLYWPGMDRGLQQEAMAIFAEEVIQAVKAQP